MSQKHLEEVATKLKRAFIPLKIAWRVLIGACWACGTKGKGYKGKDRMVCNYCDKYIKIK